MIKLLATGTVALTAALAAPAGALAAPAPAFSSHLVVVNKSIGGLTLGSSPAAARRVFGAKQCSTSGCSYSTASGATASVMFVQTSKHGKPFVGQIGFSESTPGASPFGSLRTSGDIGLGSTIRQVKAAYPKASGSERDGGLFLAGRGALRTTFGLQHGRVISISMASVRLG